MQFLLTLPFLLVFVVGVLFARAHPVQWLLLLPGLISLPVYSMIPLSDGKAVPLSRPGEQAKSVSQGLVMMAVMVVAFVIAGIASWAWRTGWFWKFIGVELVLAMFLYWGMRRSMMRLTWSSVE